MNKEVVLIKSFTTDPSRGSATGVVIDADDLTDQQMQQIAVELGFPESAFVQTSHVATYRTRFFSPKQEVDICGYATLATFHALLEKGILIQNEKGSLSVTQEARAGILPIAGHQDGTIVMTQKEPEFWEEEKDRVLIASLLGLEVDDLGTSPIQTVSTGTPKLIVPVNSLEILRKITPNLDGIIAYSKRTGNRGFYPYTPEVIEEGSDFHARHFNPIFDLNEDPITGIAAGALGAYVQHHDLSTKTCFIVEQGYVLGRSGKVIVDVSDGVKIGGSAVIYGARILKV